MLWCSLQKIFKWRFFAETFCFRDLNDILCGDILWKDSLYRGHFVSATFSPTFAQQNFVRWCFVSETFYSTLCAPSLCAETFCIGDVPYQRHFLLLYIYCAKTLRIRSFLIYILHTDVLYRDILNRDMRYHRHSFSETFCISDVLYQRPSVS